jgi:hypothetical protein
MKKVIIALNLLFSIIVFSQQQISGLILNENNMTPLNNVTIYNKNLKKYTVSDELGHYSIIGNEVDTLWFSNLGFKEKNIIGKAITDTIKLKPVLIELQPVYLIPDLKPELIYTQNKSNALLNLNNYSTYAVKIPLGKSMKVLTKIELPIKEKKNYQTTKSISFQLNYRDTINNFFMPIYEKFEITDLGNIENNKIELTFENIVTKENSLYLIIKEANTDLISNNNSPTNPLFKFQNIKDNSDIEVFFKLNGTDTWNPISEMYGRNYKIRIKVYGKTLSE